MSMDSMRVHIGYALAFRVRSRFLRKIPRRCVKRLCNKATPGKKPRRILKRKAGRPVRVQCPKQRARPRSKFSRPTVEGTDDLFEHANGGEIGQLASAWVFCRDVFNMRRQTTKLSFNLDVMHVACTVWRHQNTDTRAVRTDASQAKGCSNIDIGREALAGFPRAAFENHGFCGAGVDVDAVSLYIWCSSKALWGFTRRDGHGIDTSHTGPFEAIQPNDSS